MKKYIDKITLHDKFNSEKARSLHELVVASGKGGLKLKTNHIKGV